MGYSKQVYDRVWNILALRGRAARETAGTRRAAIFRQFPEIAALEGEMASHASAATRAIIVSPNTAKEEIEKLAQENFRIQQRRADLLALGGYPPDYLAEAFICPKCKDTGFIGPLMCECMAVLLRQEAAALLGQVSPADDMGPESFSLDYYPEIPDESGVSSRAKMKEILAFCLRWISDFSAQSESLLFIGRTGLGKTHLSIAMATEVTKAGNGVVYTPVQKMLDNLEAEKFSRDKEPYADAVAGYMGCDLLVLDDLGTEFLSQFAASALFNVLNARLAERRPTIISTNLELGEIQSRYSQRMVSRLICGYKVLRFTGKDIRYIKKVGDKT